MRILLAFVSVVAVLIAAPAVTSGEWDTAGWAGLVALVAGALLWRNLRNPEATRKQGLQAKVTFLFAETSHDEAAGTVAQVTTIHTPIRRWQVRLDRMPERGDERLIDTPQRGWVWLGEDGLPTTVRVNYAMTWKSWPVLSARAEET